MASRYHSYLERKFRARERSMMIREQHSAEADRESGNSRIRGFSLAWNPRERSREQETFMISGIEIANTSCVQAGYTIILRRRQRIIKNGF